jgi:hypothetical protein
MRLLRGPGERSDIAIDAISFNLGPCKYIV